MGSKVSEQKCPACGAPLRFDPESGRSVCDWCGTSYEIPDEDEKFDETENGSQTDNADVAEELPIYNCKSCGAEIVTDDVSASVKCPYCGNNIVLTEKVSGGLRPDGVIPFRIDKKSLPEAVSNFYKGKRLLPKNFFSESNIEDVYGIYVPFWLYDCTYGGKILFEGQRSSALREGDYIVTTTAHYDVERDVSMDFKDIPVDASSKLDDALMDSLEPFDVSDIKNFRMIYLSGFLADRFDKDSDAVRNRAEERMRSSALKVANANITRGNYSSITYRDDNMTANRVDTRYVLLPVYTFNVSYAGKKYSFAMNGQTGKVVGEIPSDKGKKLLWRWVPFAAVFALVMLFLSFFS